MLRCSNSAFAGRGPTATKVTMNSESQNLVRQYILDGQSTGQLRVGQRLPPERELAKLLGITRSTVRQALAVMEVERRITRHVGRGTFLLDTPAPPVRRSRKTVTQTLEDFEAFSPGELIQARLVIEPHITEMVVSSATQRDIERIRRVLKLQEQPENRTGFEGLDEMFHLTLARATHNALLVATTQLIARARQGREWRKLKRAVALRFGGPRTGVIAEHRAIVDAIVRRDAIGARHAMQAHLESVRKNMLGA
jgi:DNA-binding FadR family transcriptional regulator